MFRVPTETEIKAINYRDDDQVDLTLGRPNVTITLSTEQARQPWVVKHKISVQFGGRHACFGRSFDDETRGLCQKRWLELFDEAPIGICGVFRSIDGGAYNLDEVLKNGTA